MNNFADKWFLPISHLDYKKVYTCCAKFHDQPEKLLSKTNYGQTDEKILVIFFKVLTDNKLETIK